MNVPKSQLSQRRYFEDKMEIREEKDFMKDDIKYQLVEREDSPLKELIVNYVGERLHPTEPNVTVEDIVTLFADEFPEFLITVAQENWLLGYKQGIQDREETDS